MNHIMPFPKRRIGSGDYMPPYENGLGRTMYGNDHITNLQFENWREVREVYKKRWNIEIIFKATDGIQLKAQTNNPATRLFCVCLSFLFYNAWQNKNKRGTLLNYILNALESIFDLIVKTVQFYSDKLKINIPFWDIIISS